MSFKDQTNRLKYLFFILIIPILIFGEIIRYLHNKGNYSVPNGINTTYLKAKDGKQIAIRFTKKFEQAVLIVHGYLSSSKRSLVKYHDILLENGYDIVTVDMRNHGLSQFALPITAGYFERWDIQTSLKWLEENWDNRYIIASSMGAYASIYALAELMPTKQPNALILGSFGDNVKVGITRTFIDMGFSPTLAKLLVIYIHIRAPIYFEKVILEELKEIKCPTLICHGTEDNLYPAQIYQPYFKSSLGLDQDNYKFHTVENASHSELWRNRIYMDIILNFLDQNK